MSDIESPLVDLKRLVCVDVALIAIKREFESLRADRARLDWLINDLEMDEIGNSGDLREIACGIACESMEEPDNAAMDRAYLKAVRAAIDAAMKEPK